MSCILESPCEEILSTIAIGKVFYDNFSLIAPPHVTEQLQVDLFLAMVAPTLIEIYIRQHDAYMTACLKCVESLKKYYGL